MLTTMVIIFNTIAIAAMIPICFTATSEVEYATSPIIPSTAAARVSQLLVESFFRLLHNCFTPFPFRSFSDLQDKVLPK